MMEDIAIDMDILKVDIHSYLNVPLSWISILPNVLTCPTLEDKCVKHKLSL